ncbi:MAG: Rid family hydrolase [Candidatus Marinimicrobia bacterium]|nr:Rid family hydrolase [Candidatus Neomarinimicrobiota bacterium]MDA1363768.1 Rid family hydrolase [Candidatus Neomarinimicrobiota bacterium]
MSLLKSINPKEFKWFDYTRYSFSLGLSLDSDIYMSGHSASEYDQVQKKIVVNGNISEQTNTALDKIEAVLKAENKNLQNTTHIVENITNKGLIYFDLYNSVITERLPNNISRQTVVVDSLLRPDAFIEIELRIENKNKNNENIVYLPTIVADSDINRSDLVLQTKNIYEKADELLKKINLNMSDIVKTVDYITPNALQDYKLTGKVRKQFLGPIYPGATGILMSEVDKNQSLISINFTAAKGEKTYINPGWQRYEKLTYSPAVKCGSNLFMSGQAALDPETEKAVFPNDVVSQTKYTYQNILKVIDAAGLNPGNLIKTIEYVTPAGLNDYRLTSEIRKDLLKIPYPASTGIICHSLLRPEFLIEIDPFAKYF